MKRKTTSTTGTKVIKNNNDELAAAINILKASNIGSQSAWKLIETFGSAQMAISADDYTLERVGGLSPDTIRDLREAEGNGFGYLEIERAQRLGASIFLRNTDGYPQLLGKIHSPPLLLYVLGQPLPDDSKAVAIVGSRRASDPGLEVAHQLGAGLGRAGVRVVSGMALGVDGAAHRGCLQENGFTVAVLGCGIDQVYPKRHRKLRDQIVQKGTVVSELFIGAGPEAKHFPMRNRIIAGLSVGTVVVEASRKSGSLITANYALHENREVFAVPDHPLAVGSEGNNWLLRQGATPIRHAGDLLDDLAKPLGIEVDKSKQIRLPLDTIPSDLDEDELRVFNLLDLVKKFHADELSEKLNLDSSRLGAILMSMELQGFIQRLPGDYYRRVSPDSW